MLSTRASISVVAALLLGVGAAQAGAATTVQPVSMTASYTGVNWYAAAYKYGEPEWARDSGFVTGTDSAQVSKPMSLTSAGGATASGPIILAVDTSSGSLVVRLSATLTSSLDTRGSVDLQAWAGFTYTVPDVGQALTTVLVETRPDASMGTAGVSLLPTVRISSLTLGRPGYEPLQLASISPTEEGISTGQILSLIPGDTVRFDVGVNFNINLGYRYSGTVETTFEGPLWQLSLVAPGSPTPPTAACKADLNADGVVNFADLAKMKSVFFQPCTP